MQQNMRPITNQDINSVFEDMQGMPNQYINHYLLSGNPMQKLVAGLVKDQRASIKPAAQAPTQTVLEQKAQAVEPGVGALPVREDMFSEDSYARGGIIAFNNLGEVPAPAQGGVFPEYKTPDIIEPTARYAREAGKTTARYAREAGETVAQYLARIARESGMPIGQLTSNPEVAKEITLSPYRERENLMTPEGSFDFSSKNVPPPDPQGEKTGIAAPNFGGSLGAAKKDLLSGYGQAEQALSKAEQYRSPYAAQQEAGLAALEKRSQVAPMSEDAAKAEAEKAYPGKAYENYEEFLKGKVSGAESEKSKAGWAAAMMAGLGIASGKSQYALSNIAEGATKGADYYLNKIDKIDAANEQYQKGLAEIAQARRLEGQNKYKEFRRLVERGEDKLIDAQDKYFGAVSGMSNADKAVTTQVLTARAGIEAKKGEGLAGLTMDSAKLAESARQAQAQLNMYQKRMDASDRATKVKMMEILRKTNADIAKDPDYQAQLGALQAKYKDKGGLSNDEYQLEAGNLQKTFLARALESYGEDISNIPLLTDLAKE